MVRGLSSLPPLKLALTLALAMAIGAGLPRPIAAQTRGDAPGYLDLAIREFRAGRPERSAQLLSAARTLDPTLETRRPGVHKLAGWLAWLKGQRRKALPAFLQYLTARPDGPDAPFLWYLVGGASLSDRGDALRAGRAYRRAAEIAAARPAGESPRGLLAWPELAPVACPAGPVSNNSAAQRSADWLRVHRSTELPAARYAEVWNRPLHRSEVALAAFGALVAGSKAADPAEMRNDASERDRLTAILSSALDDPATRAELGEPMVNLLLGPNETAPFEACAQLLATAERHEVRQIARGLLAPAQARLKRIRSWTARLHRTRVQSQRSARGLYRYGVWLLAQARALPAKSPELASVRRLRLLQALHALRQSLAAAARSSGAPGNSASESPADNPGVRLHLLSPGLRLQSETVAELRVQTQILYRLAECYELAGREADSDALRRIAQNLAGLTGQLSALTDSRVVPVDSMDPTERTADFVYARCRENMRVRECLQILIAAAADGAPGLRSPVFYQQALTKRDESFAEEELLFVFTP